MGIEINLALVLLASTGVAFYIISTVFIYEFIKKRNDKTPSFLLVNFNIFKFVGKYKQITKDEKRRVGPLYYFWLISINLALLCVMSIVLINVIMG